VVKRPEGKKAHKQHLCADKGYAGKSAQEAIEGRKHTPHVRQRSEEVQAKKRNARYKAPMGPGKRTLSWLNRFRKLLVRFEKKTSSHEALLELACAFIVFRRIITMTLVWRRRRTGRSSASWNFRRRNRPEGS
jgi:IS5 family transposase